MDFGVARASAALSTLARTWGTTPWERSLSFPCDHHISGAKDAYFRGVDVAAPAPVVFRWLCQLRAAPYSYDWIDNFGRRSPRRLTPGLERLEVGQRVMTIFELVEFERDRHLTLKLRGGRGLFGELAVSYMLVPSDAGGCRLLAKLLVSHPRGRLRHALNRVLLPPGDMVMMRRQLLTLRDLAERDAGG